MAVGSVIEIHAQVVDNSKLNQIKVPKEKTKSLETVLFNRQEDVSSPHGVTSNRPLKKSSHKSTIYIRRSERHGGTNFTFYYMKVYSIRLVKLPGYKLKQNIIHFFSLKY